MSGSRNANSPRIFVLASAILGVAQLIGPPARAEQSVPTGCTTTSSQNRVYMDQVSDSVGYCGTFAFRALIQQYNCRESPDNCRLPAINSLLARTFSQAGPSTITDPETITAALRSGNFQTLSEDCFPFSTFWGEPSQRSLRQGTYDDLFFHRQVDKSAEHSLRGHEECLVRATWDFERTLIPRVGAILGRAFDTTLRRLNEEVAKRWQSPRCQLSHIAPFKLKPLPARTVNLGLIRAALDQGRAVMVGLKIPQPNNQGQGNHAITVVNHRELCCHGICNRQYQILDSLGFYWTPNAADGWVNESDLETAIENDQAYWTLERDPNFQPVAPDGQGAPQIVSGAPQTGPPPTQPQNISSPAPQPTTRQDSL